MRNEIEIRKVYRKLLMLISVYFLCFTYSTQLLDIYRLRLNRLYSASRKCTYLSRIPGP